MLFLEEISKKYGTTAALRPTTLEVPPRQTLVLIGPSGCGKSTLLRIIIGLVRSDSGAVFFENERLTADNVLQLRRRMGYVIQDGGLFPHLSARDNVTLMARYLKRDAGWIENRLLELAQLTQFPADALERYPVQLSGGQRQRVSLMRALMLDPDLLLLDEPLGALDPIIRSELQRDLKQIFRTLGKTVVLVTHDMGEAGYLGDQIVLMRDGEVVQQGTLAELVQQPANDFVTSFINAQRSPLESIHAKDASP
ncbi:MAG: ABC transporter ATP-binding protein [Gemmatales bacterium]|nr:MAG: ABC transporter ATP-binding protein [Gemmatales bacterium]